MTTDTKNRALVEATRDLDVLMWDGRVVDTTQILHWPRQWVRNPASPSLFYYPNTEIPDRVKNATCELAFQYIGAGTSDIAMPSSTEGITEKTIDVLTTKYGPSHTQRKGLARYPRVLNEIRPLLAFQSGEVVRG